MHDVYEFLDDMGPKESGPISEIRQLAREWAMGVHRNLWPPGFSGWIDLAIRKGGAPNDKNFVLYLDLRWPNDRFDNLLERLEGHGYIRNHRLIQSAFQLLQETTPYNVFVSYKRSDSSAFALLVSFRLNERGLVPFVDMATKVGDKWYDELHKRIKECGYFIVLLGRNTLKSDMTTQEIKWAIQYRDQGKENKEKIIIPIWHSGFNVKHKRWDCVDDIIKNEVNDTNAIRVLDESASGYNTAIVKLLNRFGITP